MNETTIKEITDRLLKDMARGPFHLADGWYFWREADGIHMAVAGPDRGGTLLHHLVVDKSWWASAVASTTAEGETGTTYRVADALLG